MLRRSTYLGKDHLERWLATMPSRFGLGAAIFIGTISFVSIFVLLQARSAAVKEAEVEAANITELLGQQTRAVLQSADVALQSMKTWVERDALEQDDDEFRQYLRTITENLEVVRALFVIGRDGFITHDTDYPETPRISLSDRRYFSALQADADLEVFVGRPIESRSVFTWFIPVARRVETPVGAFAGIVVAAVETDFIERTYGRLQLKENDAVALFHADGTLVASIPPLPDLYGARPEHTALFETHLPRATKGTYEIENPLTERPAIVGYTHLNDFPLVIAVGLDKRAALASWRHLLWTVVLANVFLTAMVLLLHLTLLQRRLEQQVARQKAIMQEKMEAVGYMTSGVAHDYRNILTAIGAGLRVLRKKGPDETLILGIEEAMRRGVDLSNDLLRFAKNKEIHKDLIAPDRQVAELKRLLLQLIGPEVRLILDLGAGQAKVEVSPAFLDSAIMNLAVNASQAMPDGGELSISTRAVDISSHVRLSPGRYVSIVSEDTGHGMSVETQKTLFQPFESTKGAQGTGLGLHQTRKFVLESGGDIEVSSEIDQGTRIEILLPIVMERMT
ncbi:MAG: hypothetical protein HKN98_09745 [Silicimonas sp.]|nr:hypothetical protein [Silicimonas sp.]